MCQPATIAPPNPAPLEFVNVADEVGLDFTHSAFHWETSGDPVAMMGLQHKLDMTEMEVRHAHNQLQLAYQQNQLQQQQVMSQDVMNVVNQSLNAMQQQSQQIHQQLTQNMFLIC